MRWRSTNGVSDTIRDELFFKHFSASKHEVTLPKCSYSFIGDCLYNQKTTLEGVSLSYYDCKLSFSNKFKNKNFGDIFCFFWIVFHRVKRLRTAVMRDSVLRCPDVLDYAGQSHILTHCPGSMYVPDFLQCLKLCRESKFFQTFII